MRTTEQFREREKAYDEREAYEKERHIEEKRKRRQIWMITN